ncbi:Cupredoxin, partial [Fennellomyces sp. T-0311]
LRHYYITAEEIEWDYAPTGRDNLRDLSLEEGPAARYCSRNSSRIGRVYTKVMFRRYLDPDFQRVAPHDPVLGFIGPILRGEAGDQFRIHFWNRASRPYSFHPYTGDLASKAPPGLSIDPDERYEYVWDVPENATQALWAYVSRADPLRDLHSGLLGPVVIYEAGTLQRPTPGSPEKPKDVDQEVFTVMTITDENMSHYLQQSADAVGVSIPDGDDPGFMESNRMYHINGFVYNNNPELHVYWGERIRWYVLSLGLGDDDPHTAHWHGATLLNHGHRVDVVDLMPVSFQILDMMPDNEGQWLFHCHVTQHFDAGMTAFY